MADQGCRKAQEVTEASARSRSRNVKVFWSIRVWYSLSSHPGQEESLDYLTPLKKPGLKKSFDHLTLSKKAIFDEFFWCDDRLDVFYHILLMSVIRANLWQNALLQWMAFPFAVYSASNVSINFFTISLAKCACALGKTN